MKRTGVLLLVAVVLGWYLFLKEYHYQVRFNASQPAGVLYYHIGDWKAYQSEAIDSVVTVDNQPFERIVQQVYADGQYVTYAWEIEPTSDSTTRVTALIRDDVQPIKRKFTVPFGGDGLVESAVKNVKDVGSMLNTNGENFRLNSIREETIPAQFCAFVQVEADLNNKASSMLYSITDVMGWINRNEMNLKGDPFLMVRSWDMDSGKIGFDFCFPISKLDSIPDHPVVQFKEVPEQRVVSTIYNGNYRLSHYAWYQLKEYAARNELEVEAFPIEHFLNDPHSGGNDLEWKALVTLPLKE